LFAAGKLTKLAALFIALDGSRQTRLGLGRLIDKLAML
jgi:hypothetical protein